MSIFKDENWVRLCTRMRNEYVRREEDGNEHGSREETEKISMIEEKWMRNKISRRKRMRNEYGSRKADEKWL